MASRLFCFLCCCGLCASLFLGCNSSSTDSDGELADLELDDETSKVLEPPKREKSGSQNSADDPPATGDLGLRLAVGDKFPLQKTVEQRLTQPTETGTSTGHSRLDLLLSLTVEELRDGKTRFAVKYHRVRYLEQDPDGNTIEFNSLTPTPDVPVQARIYAGLVNNGFSFWIGPDNQIVDLVGFKDFVQRCAREIPPAQRQTVIEQLTADRSENGVSSFIDDSIGLLPFSTDSKSSRVSVQEGSSWDLPARRIEGPVPLQVEARCKIKGLTDQTAEIDLFGKISAVDNSGLREKSSVNVRGGRCMGACVVDRHTGLPTQSRIERYIDMVVELPDGTQLPQRKEIITTIHAYLSQEQGNIQPASYSEDAPPAKKPGKTARPGSDELRLFR